MRRVVLTVLILLLSTSGLYAADPLRVGIRSDNRTIEYETASHEPAGVLVDLWRHWGKTQRRSIDFVLLDRGTGTAMLQTGQIDVLANSPDSPEYSLSAPYFSYDFYLFSLNDSELSAPSKFPLSIGLRETDSAYLNTATLSGANLITFPSYLAMIQALKTGKIDYFLANDVSMNVAVNGLALLKLNYPQTPFLSHQVRAAVRLNNVDFLPILNAQMAQSVAAIGTSVSNRWMPGTSAFRMSWSLIGLAVVILIASGLFVVVWLMNARLKDQVSQATRSLVSEQEQLRQARNRAIDSEVYIRNLIDAIHAFIIAINEAGNITHLNSYAKEFIQGEGHCRNRSYRSCFPFLTAYTGDLIDVLEGKKTLHLRKVELCLNADEKIVANLALLPFVVNGKNGALVLIEDVSEAVEHDELLVQSQKLELIQSLAGGVAHDFNNILAVISGSANLMKRQLAKSGQPDRSKMARYLENIFTAADKGVATTKGLASLSGKVSVDFGEFSMNQAVESVIQICTSTMDTSVKVHYIVPERIFQIHGNRGLLEQALLNVIINAYHAMTIMRPPGSEKGGGLVISLELSSGCSGIANKELCLVVKDSGVGIAAEHIDDVCTPFYTTKKSGVGTGLGLSMVQNTLMQHQGRLEISSILGEGTEVRLFLPCSLHDNFSLSVEKNQALRTPLVVSKKAGVILIADDNNPVRESLAENLMLYGYQVLQAGDGAELVELYLQNQPRVEVIVTDLEMPVMTGDKAFFAIRASDPDAKVIISSGFLEDERIRTVLAHEVDDFIQKPCVISELVAKIEALRCENTVEVAGF